MRYQVTNNSRNPRVIFHGGKSTLVGVGETTPISMLKADADNAVAEGLDIVKASDAEDAEGGTRIFLAVGEDAQGAGMAPLEVGAGQFIGIAYGTEAPTDPRDYSWRPVVDTSPAPADENDVPDVVLNDTQAGPDTQGGERADTISGPDGNDSAPNPDEPAPDALAGSDAIDPEPAPLRAVHRGRGSYSIMRGDADVEVTEQLTKADADAFNALSAEEREELIKARG